MIYYTTNRVVKCYNNYEIIMVVQHKTTAHGREAYRLRPAPDHVLRRPYLQQQVTGDSKPHEKERRTV